LTNKKHYVLITKQIVSKDQRLLFKGNNTMIQNNTTTQNINPVRTLNILEASQLLGAHKETIRRMAASGVIPGVKIGRSWRFIEHEVVDPKNETVV
jgi:excisionase family DNA binding protein